jgi:glycosyltransferase involved in cell wall biosynthesis
MTSQLKVTVIVCSCNPRSDYLQRVLVALRHQTLSKSEWELLLIDNCSADSLKTRVDLGWHPSARVVREEELGLATARSRAIAESSAEILVFVDDDNVLYPDYLEQCLRISADWPQLGSWGGSIVPEFETKPPEHLQPYLKILALREVTRPRWSNVWNCKDAEPWGPGLCIRRRAALAYREFFKKSPLYIGGRTGESLLSGEDTEMNYVTCSLGLGMGIFPELKVVHLIPKFRLDEQYLGRLAQGLETSSIILFFKWGGIRPRSPFSPRVLIGLLKNCLLKRGIDRRLYLASFRARTAATKIIREQEKTSQTSAFTKNEPFLLTKSDPH